MGALWCRYFYLKLSHWSSNELWEHFYRSNISFSFHRVHSTILSGSTDMLTITLKVPSHSLSHNNSRLSSATGQVWLMMSSKMFFVMLLSIFPVSVTGCDAFFKIRYRLREHMRSHTQERLVACPTCGSMFSSNTKLFDHLHRQAEPVGKTNSSVCIISVLKVYHNAHFVTFMFPLNRVAGLWTLWQSFFQRETFKGSCSSAR